MNNNKICNNCQNYFDESELNMCTNGNGNSYLLCDDCHSRAVMCDKCDIIFNYYDLHSLNNSVFCIECYSDMVNTFK